MKITQIMLAKGFGGAERHFVDLSLSLADRGYRVQAICHSKFGHQAALSAHPNIEVASLTVLAAWDMLARIRIRRMIAAFQPDVIHTHLARGALMGGAAAKALGIPAVVNLHNYIDLKYYGNIAAFIAATEDQKNYLLAQGVDTQKITVMPHFSMLPAMAVQPLDTSKPVTFVTLGRMVHKKGFDVLLRAFRRYLDAGHSGQLLIGGDGVEKTALAQLVTDLNLQDNVQFPGWIQDAGRFLAQGDVFVLPSRDEPFGIVVLEAMASGKPIITTRTKGPITVLDESTAFFTDIGDVETLTHALLAAVNDPTATTRKAQAALALYQSHYSADAVVPRVEAIYRQLAP